jgi:hypothetical protein
VERKASPSAGRPNITKPKIAVAVKITEQNLTKATHNPRQDHACGSRFRPYIHVHVPSYKEPRDPDRQTDPSRGTKLHTASTSIPTRGRHSHTHAHQTTFTRHDSLSCTAYVQLHTYIHAHNEQSRTRRAPPCRVFRTKQAQRSTIPGCRNDKRENLPLECLVEPATTALVSSFFPFVTFSCNSLLLLPKSYITWSG